MRLLALALLVTGLTLCCAAPAYERFVDVTELDVPAREIADGGAE